MDELFVIEGGRVVDPSTGLDGVRDLVFLGERVFAVAKPGGGGVIAQALTKSRAVSRTTRFDASGLVVVPGFVDMHVHFREPGGTESETIHSGAHAAVAGGYTSVATMPNTEPPVDSCDAAIAQREAGERAGYARVFPIGALTAGRAGKEPSDAVGLSRGGAVALSDDGSGVLDAGVMRRCMRTASDLGLLVSDHAEDCSISGCGVMHEGPTSLRLRLPGKPRAAEDVMVARDIAIAADVGARLHVAHLSTAGAARLVRKAKIEGLPVSCEVTPHHLALVDGAVDRDGVPDPNYKMNPPLRESSDREALLLAIRDGTIDAIATDHAPHPKAQKDLGFLRAPNGVIGLETALPVMYTTLVRQEGAADLSRLVELMSTKPARLLGIPGGTLAPGSPADVAVLDLESLYEIDPATFRSGSRNTPFTRWSVWGRAVLTFVGGKPVHAAGNLVHAHAPDGTWTAKIG